jgi:hypothetical protein
LRSKVLKKDVLPEALSPKKANLLDCLIKVITKRLFAEKLLVLAKSETDSKFNRNSEKKGE